MKSILVHVRKDPGMESRLQVALDLARAETAHITFIQVTPYRSYVSMDPMGGAYALTENLKAIQASEDALRTEIEEQMSNEGVPWDFIHDDGDETESILSASRLADIVILSSPKVEPEDEGFVLPIVADVAVTARCPVLAVRSSVKSFSPAGKAFVAWNGSHEAANALRATTSLLSLASEVHVVTISEKEGGFPSTQAVEYLSRHGIKAELHDWPRDKRSIEETLEAAAKSLEADFIVMGAYGHSRLRETLFGGVTKYFLDDCKIPLVLAH